MLAFASSKDWSLMESKKGFLFTKNEARLLFKKNPNQKTLHYYFMCMSLMPVCLWTMYVQCLQRPEKCIRSPETGVTAATWVMDIALGFSGKALTTETFLQTHWFFLLKLKTTQQLFLLLKPFSHSYFFSYCFFFPSRKVMPWWLVPETREMLQILHEL